MTKLSIGMTICAVDRKTQYREISDPYDFHQQIFTTDIDSANVSLIPFFFFWFILWIAGIETP